MPSRAERGECSALHDGVVGARRAGAFQAKRGVFLVSRYFFYALRLENEVSRLQGPKATPS